MAESTTVVHDASQLVVGPGRDEPLEVIDDGAVAVVDGRIAAVGSTDDVTEAYAPDGDATAIDASGQTVIPGLVDAHTHAVYAGDRADEFEARLAGASYQEILEGGGGILRTVEAVRETDRRTLRDDLVATLDTMLAHGATTVEVKSGYGLTVEDECKMLEAVAEADAVHPVDLVPTFMGAHATPADTDPEAYVETVIAEQLPAVADADLAEFCDVFCDEGAFTPEQARRILEAAAEQGLAAKIHADEFERLGGSRVAADLGAVSADHLLNATEADVAALAEAGVVPTLLPATAFTLGVPYADLGRFIDAGAWPAIASDFNPNCHVPSMLATLQFACHGMGMTPAGALRGATAEAARAVDRPDRGQLTPGSRGDLVVLDVPSHVHAVYTFGVNHVDAVLKGGALVHG